MTTSTNRWNTWLDRAKTCFRAATAIDAGTVAVASALKDLATQNSEAELLQALKDAEAALVQARQSVQTALQAWALTAANREPLYGLVG